MPAERDREEIERLRGEVVKLRAALEYARPFVEKWCHYQGDVNQFFMDTLLPIDIALGILRMNRESDD